MQFGSQVSSPSLQLIAMTFMGDERASRLVGLFLFGVLFLAVMLWSFLDGPQHMLFNMSNSMADQPGRGRFDGIGSVPGQPSRQAVSVQLGTRYPSRLVATNPGPPSGLLYTDGTSNESQNLTIRNAEARTPETADYWDGTTPRHYKGGDRYTPETTSTGRPSGDCLRHSSSTTSSVEGNVTLSEQTMVDGRDITLVTLNGSMSRSTSDSVTVDVEPTSQSSRTVRVQIRRRHRTSRSRFSPASRGGSGQ